ncbi:MAG: helix-turn-helix domain-containing protein, partial [Bdellovibrionales bacterium]|nr:helix-turn-helix domain-containing protein [Bdellovibrionales bacterium]
MEPSVEARFENTTVDEIAVAKRCAPTQQGLVRYQALEQLYRGKSKEEVARLNDRSVRTIERWIFLFRERGIDGLALKGSSFLDEFA